MSTNPRSTIQQTDTQHSQAEILRYTSYVDETAEKVIKVATIIMPGHAQLQLTLYSKHEHKYGNDIRQARLLLLNNADNNSVDISFILSFSIMVANSKF